ncbi:hypothetical protein [Pseudosulfitobacter sp. SM2401]|uniref:hypothetical protein n=1 Tax=Pseudosulfitobacter sp. SM2401 TaxID=3350098 RepID=UPI0036F390C6
METFFIIAITLAIFAFLIWLCIFVPLKMARNRNRSGLGWVLISVLVSPLVAIVALLAMGPAEDKTDLSETFA